MADLMHRIGITAPELLRSSPIRIAWLSPYAFSTSGCHLAGFVSTL